MEHTPQRRSRKQQKQDAKEALLDAALTLFAAHGVAEVSLADIGKAAGFSRGLVNHHFGSRAVLMRMLAERTRRQILDEMERFAEAEVPPGGGIERMVEMVEGYFERARQLGEYSRAYHVLRGVALASEDPMRGAMAAGEAKARGYVERVVRRGQETGDVRADLDPVDTAAWLVAMLRGIVGSQLLADNRPLDGAERLCTRVVRDTLSPGPESRGSAST